MAKLTKYLKAIFHFILITYCTITYHGSIAQNLRLEMQTLHSDSINYVSKSFDEKYTITSSYDGFTKVWDNFGNVILSVEGYQSTFWYYGRESSKYRIAKGGGAINSSELVVVDGSSGVVRCFELGSKKVIRQFSTDSLLNYRKSLWSRAGLSQEEMDRQLELSKVLAKAYFVKIDKDVVLVINRLLYFYQDRYQDNNSVDMVELWSIRENGKIEPYTGDSRQIPFDEFEVELKNKVEIESDIKKKWNGSNIFSQQSFKEAVFSKRSSELLITAEKSTTVVNFETGQVKENYRHPRDTNSSPVKLVPIKTLDSILFRPTNFGKQPLVTKDFKFAVFPAYSQVKYLGLSSILDLQKNQVVEFPYGPDSLYAFQYSPNGLWRVEIRDMNPLIFDRMKGEGYKKANPIEVSLFFKSKLIFQTDTYCDISFSTDSKWVNFRNPETGMSALFPLLDIPDQFNYLPLMSVVKLPKKSKRDTPVSLFQGNIYTDTTTLRFLFNSLSFSSSNHAYAGNYINNEDYMFASYVDALSETLVKNKNKWDQFAKDTIGLDFKSSWLSCRWMIAEPQEIKFFSSFFINILEEPTNWFKLSPNGRYLLTITETEEQEFIHSIRRDGFFGGDKINLTLKLHDSWNRTSTTINKTDKELPAYKVKFSEDGSLMYYINEDKLIVINSSSQSVYHTFTLDAEIQNGDISLDNSKLIITTRSEVSIWDLKNKMKMLSFQLTEDGKLLATHPSGLFDANVKLLNEVHFVQNGSDVISFTQLKDRYYEPGLWKKVISGEKLREVVTMKSIELPPDIIVGQVDSRGYLPIDLTNKGGGIGEVTVLINGKEAIIDARPKGSDSKAKQLSLKVFISNHKALIKGAENFLAVKAWNEGHWVVSRGAIVRYSIEGNDSAYKPVIHIITSGVSDYTGTELDLKYAAKDAEDVSKALQLGAKRLFGAEKSIIYNLTTTQSANQHPTKSNILKAFEKVTSVAHPLDIVVVYLSGHGINYGGQDGDWYYLTQDAHTSNSTAYNDPEIRRTSTLSSNELVDLFKNIPSLKQVLMIDACASGKVVENLMAKKDIESTTLRALDRMRDRTGLHIITGCTADAVSYEASKYGQGVLTYSLLEGIRGAALREDQFVDVNKLFQYAQDRVPALAVGIGGIQTPQVFSPQGSQSFDIGLLTEQEKKDIPIAKIRPVYIRSSFIDDDQLEDALQLGKKVDDALNEAAVKGAGAPLIFVDVREYPEGCKLSGKYRQVKGVIKLKLRKKCEGKDETIEISGKTAEEVTGKIISSL